MEKHELMVQMGLWQLADWARAYVQSETVIPETPSGQLSPGEVAALALMGAILSQRAG